MPKSCGRSAPVPQEHSAKGPGLWQLWIISAGGDGVLAWRFFTEI